MFNIKKKLMPQWKYRQATLRNGCKCTKHLLVMYNTSDVKCTLVDTRTVEDEYRGDNELIK